MAFSDNPLLRGINGHIDKTIVVKDCPWDDNLVIISSYPDMSNIEPSGLQKAQRLSFKQAQAIACQWVKQPEIVADYKARCQPGQRPYDLMKSELMKGIVPKFKEQGK